MRPSADTNSGIDQDDDQDDQDDQDNQDDQDDQDDEGKYNPDVGFREQGCQRGTCQSSQRWSWSPT